MFMIGRKWDTVREFSRERGWANTVPSGDTRAWRVRACTCDPQSKGKVLSGGNDPTNAADDVCASVPVCPCVPVRHCARLRPGISRDPAREKFQLVTPP